MRGIFAAAVLAAVGVVGCTSGEKKEESSWSVGMETGAGNGKAWAVAEKTVERPAEVTMRGKPVTLQGESPAVGTMAPKFVGVGNDLSEWKFIPGGKVVILSAVPSLDTKVCSAETHRFNEEIDKLNKDGVPAEVVTLSMDLPFAQKRWCGAEGVTHITTVSDFKDRDFASKYGVRIKENGLLARAVFVVGKDGKIAYVEICKELASEPDYAKVMEAAKAASK